MLSIGLIRLPASVYLELIISIGLAILVIICDGLFGQDENSVGALC